MRTKVIVFLVVIAVIAVILWIVPAVTHRGIVTGKERIPATRHYNADGTTRTTPEAYYITVESWSGDQVTFRCSEDQYTKNTVGEKYSS